MPRWVIAADNGPSGCVCLLREMYTTLSGDTQVSCVGWFDTPSRKVSTGSGKRKRMRTKFDHVELVRGLKRLMRMSGEVSLCAEAASNPGDGYYAIFDAGANEATWQSMAAALDLDLVTVSPRRWQRDVLYGGKTPKGLTRDEHKANSLRMAAEMFPGVPLFRPGSPSLMPTLDGRSDALMIGTWYLQHGGMK